jgi:tight adherence protein B
MTIFVIAALVFFAIFTTVLGIWWIRDSGQRLKLRLSRSAAVAPELGILKVDPNLPPSIFEQLARRSDLVGQLTSLADQAGSKQSAADLLLLIAALGIGGGAAGWWRASNLGAALLSAIILGSLPVFYLRYKRSRRLKRFEEHFADAVDMIARSIRAGNALSMSIQLVGEEMADPIGHEFRHVTEQIRLGLDPGDALSRLQQRIPTEDVKFFCNAIQIQRGAGGNLAEILDRLSEVIRKRFELLSHARVLSAQQRFAAIFVGLSPLAFSLIFYFLSPEYFDPLIESPIAPMLVTGGLAMELVGFLIIWRMARIKV